MFSTRLDDTGHRRCNQLNGSWVLLASPHKLQRPRQQAIKTQGICVEANEQNAYDEKCYLCPGNTRARGDRNPNYARTFLFENDYSTVQMNQGECGTGIYTPISVASDLLQAELVIGRCYVLAYSANHSYTMANMSPRELLDIIQVWTKVYAKHLSLHNPLRLSTTRTTRSMAHASLKDDDNLDSVSLRYMQIFDNNGEIVGCSNSHPHGQIWITSSMPEEPRLELLQMTKYRRENFGRHLLADYAKVELEKQERFVFQNDGFLVVCPWWAVWPFEVLLLPKRHIRALVDLSRSEKVQMAEPMLQIANRYDNLFGITFRYVSAIHQAPLSGTDEEMENSYLHMHFAPPLIRPGVRKFFGGYELYAEPSREITPESAAACLRCAES